MTVQAYPLSWPMGRDRTPAGQRSPAKFGTEKREYMDHALLVVAGGAHGPVFICRRINMLDSVARVLLQ